MAWGLRDVQLTDPVEAANLVEAEESFTEQPDNHWDPTRSGLPVDITQDLEADPSATVDEVGN